MAKMDNTLRKGNIKSLMHDDVLENGVPFVDAFRENPEVVNMTYEELGIDPKDMTYRDAKGGSKTIDLDGDGKISEQEATLLSPQDRELIIDAMTNPNNPNYNEERTRAEMAKYFTGFIQQNYNNEYESSGGKFYSDAADQYGEGQEGADNFMKEQGII